MSVLRNIWCAVTLKLMCKILVWHGFHKNIMKDVKTSQKLLFNRTINLFPQFLCSKSLETSYSLLFIHKMTIYPLWHHLIYHTLQFLQTDILSLCLWCCSSFLNSSVCNNSYTSRVSHNITSDFISEMKHQW